MAGYPAHLHLDKHRRSLALYCLIARRLEQDPSLLEHARATVDRWIASNQNHAMPYLLEWRKVLHQGVEATVALMTDPGPHATDMRQSAPFTGILTETERLAFLAEWRTKYPR